MTSELARRIAFTLGALFVYRLGTYIPLSGIARSSGQLSIFSLSIIPYLSAAIIIQLMSLVSSKLSTLARSGEAGRRRIARYTLGLALFLTVFQAFGIASRLQDIPGIVSDSGGLFLLSATVTLTGGAVFLIWLSEQITARGIGNGLVLILFAGVVAGLPQTFASIAVLAQQGQLSGNQIALRVILWVAVVGLVVFVELARRRVAVEFAARKLGDRLLPARSSYLSLKLNSAGLMPTIVAPWLLFLPLMFAGFVFGSTAPWLTTAFRQIEQGRLGHMILSSIAIIIFAFIYTSFVVDPDHAADSLKQLGGVIPGVALGEPTAEHVDRVVSYTTVVGAVYLAAVFLIPEVLLTYSQVPFYFGGGSALVVVCTVLDIETQVRGRSLTEPGGLYS